MAKRKRMSRGKSSRVFKKGTRVKGRNFSPNPMRGGFRI